MTFTLDGKWNKILDCNLFSNMEMSLVPGMCHEGISSLPSALNKAALQSSTVIYLTNKAAPKPAWPFDHRWELGKQQAIFAN